MKSLRMWPRRRWVVGGVLASPLTLMYLRSGPPVELWWAAPTALVCGGLAALVLASYVPLPGSGRWIDSGCTPCSTVAAFTVLGSLMLRDSDPLAAGMSLIAAVILLFGLYQRLSGGVCAVPYGR